MTILNSEFFICRINSKLLPNIKPGGWDCLTLARALKVPDIYWWDGLCNSCGRRQIKRLYRLKCGCTCNACHFSPGYFIDHSPLNIQHFLSTRSYDLTPTMIDFWELFSKMCIIMHAFFVVEFHWSVRLITPPRNRGGVIFSLQFVCVSVCVCVCVCVCPALFLWTKFQPNGYTYFDAVFTKIFA